ncbi:MAG: hypothetical protein LUD02_01980 [Tannerellaceae bacterium]|nr:hypothetical protein [Tannerellaceae bacterium]MCD8263056.1 hypothetical protein [Tannerellaceae bacterium]
MADTYYTDHIISDTYDNQTVAGNKTYNGLASYLIRANYNYDSNIILEVQ